jgi:hypothetical protein
MNTAIAEGTMRIRRRLVGGLVAGLFAGLFLGIMGRIVMRILALAGNMTPTFTIQASLGIVLIGVIIGLISALVYALLTTFLPPFRGLGVVYGLLVMGVMFLLLPDLVQGELANSENGQLVLRLAAGLFALVFAAFGLILQTISTRMGKIAASPFVE